MCVCSIITLFVTYLGLTIVNSFVNIIERTLAYKILILRTYVKVVFVSTSRTCPVIFCLLGDSVTEVK